MREIWRLSEEIRAEIFADVSQTEREQFMAVLERLHDNISRLDGKPADPGARC
jgi:DNA-binding MarR family transcriptional regulator